MFLYFDEIPSPPSSPLFLPQKKDTGKRERKQQHKNRDDDDYRSGRRGRTVADRLSAVVAANEAVARDTVENEMHARRQLGGELTTEIEIEGVPARDTLISSAPTAFADFSEADKSEIKSIIKEFIKENPDGTPSEERLTTNFSTTVTDWNNILVELTLPRFQLKSLEGWSFEVSNAVFDFSDTRNSADIKFPTDYDSPYFIEGTRELWRGFYLRELVVTLPKEFNKKNTTGRTSFRAAEILIDE